MKFSNPWIDPRILQVRPEAARACLLGHGLIEEAFHLQQFVLSQLGQFVEQGLGGDILLSLA